MKFYTLEEDHKDTCGYCYTIGVFSDEEKAKSAKQDIIASSFDYEKRPKGTILDIDTEKLFVYEWDLDSVDIKNCLSDSVFKKEY